MISNNKSYDISLSKEDFPQTELINYSNINNSEKTSDTEFNENYDNDEDLNNLKEQINTSLTNSKLLIQNYQINKTMKYRRGNLICIYYNKKGNPIIVIGPDCK